MSSIDRPQHDGGAENPYETIKVLEAWMTRDEMIGFCKGNAPKYLSRHSEKGELSDLEKSAWYSRYMVEYLKADAEKPNIEVQGKFSRSKVRLDQLVKLNLKGAKTAKKPNWVDADLPEPDALLSAEDFAGIDA